MKLGEAEWSEVRESRFWRDWLGIEVWSGTEVKLRSEIESGSELRHGVAEWRIEI